LHPKLTHHLPSMWKKMKVVIFSWNLDMLLLYGNKKVCIYTFFNFRSLRYFFW
jgi:hypothetical protein